jgi:uncharacterized protein YjbJ (UPF0337 family)
MQDAQHPILAYCLSGKKSAPPAFDSKPFIANGFGFRVTIGLLSAKITLNRPPRELSVGLRPASRMPAHQLIHHMNTQTFKGNWQVIKGKLRQKFARLTDNDLAGIEGVEEELVGRIQKKTGRSREEIEKFLTEDCGCTFPSSASIHNESGGDRPVLYDDEPVRRNEALHPG